MLELGFRHGIIDPRRCDCSLCRRRGAIVASALNPPPLRVCASASSKASSNLARTLRHSGASFARESQVRGMIPSNLPLPLRAFCCVPGSSQSLRFASGVSHRQTVRLLARHGLRAQHETHERFASALTTDANASCRCLVAGKETWPPPALGPPISAALSGTASEIVRVSGLPPPQRPVARRRVWRISG